MRADAIKNTPQQCAGAATSRLNKLVTKNPPAKGRGRPKGSQNKTTVAVKEALNLAFANIGGAQALTTWAKQNETEFYKLWVKMLPQDVNANVQATLKVTRVELVGPDDHSAD